MLNLIIGGILLVFSFVLGQVVANSRYMSRMEKFINSWAAFESTQYDRLAIAKSRLKLYNRALKYEQLIHDHNLEEGMVVVRHENGDSGDVCDSLLFSSLRFVALKKLKLHDEAEEAWSAIKRSRDQGHWFRHPQCADRGTSRDMMLGILAAFTQEPSDKRALLVDMLRYISDNNGFFSAGRIDVSFLLPGVAEILRVYAEGNRIVNYTFPVNLDFSFSTIEFGAIFPMPGYQSHLIALSAWIEFELSQKPQYAHFVGEQRNAVAKIAPLINPFALANLEDQRLHWISYQLYSNDPRNLFFKYLYLKSIGALNDSTRLRLIKELLEMREFPIDRLPKDCDRKADYLWQRHSWEYDAHFKQCGRTFHGVDFLWMASILLSDGNNGPTQ